MKIALRAIPGLSLFVLIVLGCRVPAEAQTQISALVTATCGTPGVTLTPGRPGVITQNNSGQLCVNATVSASVSGFAPAGTFANLTATGSSASVALPAGAVVAFQNTGTTAVSCTLGIGSATASASQNVIQAGSTVYFTVGSNTFGACIDQTGSTSNVVALSGGTGLGAGFGGGGSGGSSGAVFGPTAVGSAAANPPVLMGGTANGAATGNVAVAEIKAGNAFAASDPAVGVADPNVLSALNTGNSSLATIAANTGSAIPAGSALIGKVGIDQTTPGTTNGVAPSTSVGTAAFAATQVSVGSTATSILSARTGAPGTGRASATITNTTTTAIFIGGSGVTTSTGTLLPGIVGASITINTTAAIFGIVATGTATVTSFETF